MKDFLLKLKMVGRQISYMTPKTFIDRMVIFLANIVWYILWGNIRVKD